jgi:alpha-L-rhamnosidase
VASNAETIEGNNGDLWDSERVVSTASTAIEYKGKRLKLGKTCYWKVRVWDEEKPLGRLHPTPSVFNLDGLVFEV